MLLCMDIRVDGSKVRFEVESWQALKKVIRPVGYGIQSHMMTTMSLLEQSEELPELFMKSGEEIKLWRMLRRLTSRVFTSLDDVSVDRARKVLAYQIGHVEVVLNTVSGRIEVMQDGEVLEVVSLELLRRQPAQAFRLIRELVFQVRHYALSNN